MSQIPHSPTLTGLAETCKAPGAITDASVVHDGESNVVRFVLHDGDLELVIDSQVETVPGSAARQSKAPALRSPSPCPPVEKPGSGILGANQKTARRRVATDHGAR